MNTLKYKLLVQYQTSSPWGIIRPFDTPIFWTFLYRYFCGAVKLRARHLNKERQTKKKRTMQIIINSESKYRQIFSSILNRSFLIPLSVQLRVQNIMNYFYIYTLQHAEIKLQIGGSAVFFPTG